MIFAKKIINLTLILISSITISSQNLVPNPGFEDFLYPPKKDGNFQSIKNWKNSSGVDATDYQYGTPDFFHKSGTDGAKIPNTQMGIILPHKGEGVVGIMAYNKDVENFREYIYTKLLSDLIPNKEYIISFAISNGFQNQYGRLSCDRLGLYFSNTPLKQKGNEVLVRSPQIVISEPICSDIWKTFKFSFTPTESFSYLTIGNFSDDSSLNLNTCFPKSTSEYAYYLIDEVKVIPKKEPISIQAINDRVFTSGQAVSIDVLNNDLFPANKLTRICDFTYPENGLVIQGNQTLIYTPNKKFHGMDSFTYSICIDGKKSTASVNIEVEKVEPELVAEEVELEKPEEKEVNSPILDTNLKPTALDDYYTIDNNFPFTICPLDNDSDPENDKLLIIEIDNPTYGKLIRKGDCFEYHSHNNNFYKEKFTYIISDGNDNLSEAEIIINIVIPQNTAPVAKMDSVTSKGTPIQICVLENDYDLDGDDLSIIENNFPIHGSLTKENQCFIYTPNDKFEGIDSFTYQISDGKEKSSFADVNIRVELEKPESTNDLDFFSTQSLDGFPANHLTFLIDVSRSMNEESRLPLLKETLKRFFKILRPEDYVSIVVFSGNARVVVGSLPGSEKNKLSEAVENLNFETRTNVTNGLQLAYSTAHKNYIPSGNNRIIISTDGKFQSFETLITSIKKNLAKKKDINLSVFCFSKSVDKATKKELTKMALVGKGKFSLVTPENLDKVILEEVQTVRR